MRRAAQIALLASLLPSCTSDTTLDLSGYGTIAMVRTKGLLVQELRIAGADSSIPFSIDGIASCNFFDEEVPPECVHLFAYAERPEELGLETGVLGDEFSPLPWPHRAFRWLKRNEWLEKGSSVVPPDLVGVLFDRSEPAPCADIVRSAKCEHGDLYPLIGFTENSAVGAIGRDLVAISSPEARRPDCERRHVLSNDALIDHSWIYNRGSGEIAILQPNGHVTLVSETRTSTFALEDGIFYGERGPIFAPRTEIILSEKSFFICRQHEVDGSACNETEAFFPWPKSSRSFAITRDALLVFGEGGSRDVSFRAGVEVDVPYAEQGADLGDPLGVVLVTTYRTGDFEPPRPAELLLHRRDPIHPAHYWNVWGVIGGHSSPQKIVAFRDGVLVLANQALIFYSRAKRSCLVETDLVAIARMEALPDGSVLIQDSEAHQWLTP